MAGYDGSNKAGKGSSLEYGRVIPNIPTPSRRVVAGGYIGTQSPLGLGLGGLLGAAVPSAVQTIAPRSVKEAGAAGVGAFLTHATPVGWVAGALGGLGIGRGLWGSSKSAGDKDATAAPGLDATTVEEFRNYEGGADLRGLRYNDVKNKYYNANGDEYNNEHEAYLLNSLGKYHEFAAMRRQTKEFYLKYKEAAASTPGRAGTIIVPMDNKTANAVIGSSVPSTGTVIG